MNTLRELRALAPEASVAPHHLFRPSPADGHGATGSPARATRKSVGHVGVIDTGADLTRPFLLSTILATEGFTDGGYVPRSHGTVVSEIPAQNGVSIGALMCSASTATIVSPRRLQRSQRSIGHVGTACA
jgi:hypothetical protein